MKGYELRELLKKNHISQYEIAEVLGVSYVTISRWIAKDTEIAAKYLPRIAETCANGLPNFPVTKTEQRLLKSYRKLTSGKRRSILQQIERQAKGICNENTQA